MSTVVDGDQELKTTPFLLGRRGCPMLLLFALQLAKAKPRTYAPLRSLRLGDARVSPLTSLLTDDS